MPFIFLDLANYWWYNYDIWFMKEGKAKVIFCLPVGKISNNFSVLWSFICKEIAKTSFYLVVCLPFPFSNTKNLLKVAISFFHFHLTKCQFRMTNCWKAGNTWWNFSRHRQDSWFFFFCSFPWSHDLKLDIFISIRKLCFMSSARKQTVVYCDL